MRIIQAYVSMPKESSIKLEPLLAENEINYEVCPLGDRVGVYVKINDNEFKTIKTLLRKI